MSTGARIALLAFAAALFLSAIFAARPTSTPGPLARDFEAYWSAGATWNSGGNPYERTIWNAERTVPGVDASRDELLPFVGPPQTVLLWSVFARLPYPQAAQIWIALLVLCIPAIVLMLIRRCNSPPTWCFFALALLAVSFGPVTSDLALGQIALVALAGILAVSSRAQSRDAVTSSIGWLVAFFQPNVAIAGVSQLGRNRVTLGAICALVATYGLGAIVSGWLWPVRYAQLLSAHAGAERFSAIQITPGAIAYGLGAPQPASVAVAVIFAAAAMTSGVLVWRAIEDRFVRFAAFVALTPFVATFFHEHDLIVAFVPAAWCAMRTSGQTRMIALCGTLLVAVDWLGLAQRPTGIGQSALIALAAACAFSALGSREDLRGSTIVTVAFVGLFALGSWLASQHPVPVWPDVLGAFQAPANANVATVWTLEQQRNGLLTVAPVAAFLRALSLLGCGLLAVAVVIYRRPSYYRTA